MQPITCDACRKPAASHDVVNYGSMEGGYRRLCARCFNEAAASRLRLEGFEHVGFEPVRMVDERGTEAAALAAAMAGDARFEQLLGLGALQLGLDPGWSQAGHNEVMALQDMAASGKKLGRGAAWGILYALGATDSLPTGLLPVEYRSARANETDASTAERPVVGAYPNPAKDRLMITWPAEVDAGTLEVIDARGRSVLSQALGSRTGFVELDVRGWADGLYLARVLRAGQVVGETKCAIAR
jgi:hypothetical protein